MQLQERICNIQVELEFLQIAQPLYINHQFQMVGRNLFQTETANKRISMEMLKSSVVLPERQDSLCQKSVSNTIVFEPM
jgi:hypothetical protein